MSASLFDNFGRRVPYPGLRIFSQLSRRYYVVNQPASTSQEIYERLRLNNLAVSSLEMFSGTIQAIMGVLAGHSVMANLTKGVHVPFMCPATTSGHGLAQDIKSIVNLAGKSFEKEFPGQNFYDRSGGFPKGDIVPATGSRYERLQNARQSGQSVMGVWFPDCLSGYDLDSQRIQVKTLPEKVGGFVLVLSGAVEAAAGLVGCPELLRNETAYPHHLCLSGIADPDEDRFVYTFESYGLNLAFNRRSNILVPGVKQLSEQFAGGLTLFTALK